MTDAIKEAMAEANTDVIRGDRVFEQRRWYNTAIAAYNEEAMAEANTAVIRGDRVFEQRRWYNTAIAAYNEGLMVLRATEDRLGRVLLALKAAEDRQVCELVRSGNRAQEIRTLIQNNAEAQNRTEDQIFNLAQKRASILLKRATAYNKIGEWSLSKVDCMFYLKVRGDENMMFNHVFGKALYMVGDYQRAKSQLDRWLAKYELKKALGQYDAEADSCVLGIERTIGWCESVLNGSTKEIYTQTEKLKDLIQDALISTRSECDFRNTCKLLDVVFQCAYDSCTDPSYLICPVTRELFRDPVICPSGASYERSSIEQLMNSVTAVPREPLTRRKLENREIYPNLRLKEVVEKFNKRRGALDRSWKVMNTVKLCHSNS